jgi:hypothetical protein
MQNHLISFLLSIIICNTVLFSQNNSPSHEIDSIKSYFSIAVIPSWNKVNVSKRSGELDKVKGSVTSGLVLDVAYLRFSKKFIYNFSLGHGYYKEGFYFRYDSISNPTFPYTSQYGFEENRPMQYSSFKFSVSNNFKKTKQKVMYYGGIDFRLNWGYDIFTTGDRFDVSHGSQQVIDSEFEEDVLTSFFYSNSIITRFISINPIVGVDYILGLKNKTFFSLGIFCSIPFIPVIKSKVEFYPDFEDLKSSFNTSFNGGLLGIKISYIIPN